MAKVKNELMNGVACYSGYVDGLKHVGDNEYGRTGDWMEIAVSGGVIQAPALVVAEPGEQVIVRGILRNRGRVIDFVTNDILVCRTEEELNLWERSLEAYFRISAKLELNVYEKPTLVNKVLTKYTSRFRCIGIQFNVPLSVEQYLKLKPLNGTEADFQFDLVRDFRITGGEGNRNTIDTWILQNPVQLVRKTRSAPSPENSK